MTRYLNESQLLKIRKIDFSNNRLTYHAGAAFANQLRHVCRLVHLKLDNNLLGDNGIGKILDAMIESGGAHGLVRLELKNNNITLGTKSLMNLPKFKNIKALDLANNCITVDTKHQRMLFINIIQSLTNIVFLSLSNNKIKDDGFDILMNEIMPRDNIKRIDLSNCFITSKSIKLIQKIVTMECNDHKYDCFMLQGHIIGSELLPELRYMINNHSLNIFFESNNSDRCSIEYPLLYDDTTLNAYNSNEIETQHSKQSEHRQDHQSNRRKATPKDYYDYEEQQKLHDNERNTTDTTLSQHDDDK
jgi:Ran GTPase-activating protein (RanGAP) involved in mRNA processing and transport